MMRYRLFLCGVLMFGMSAWAGQIDLDSSVTYQQFKGWEGTAWINEGYAWWTPQHRDQLVDMAVELGITRLRLEVRSGTEYPEDKWSSYQRGEMEYADWRAIRGVAVNDNDDPWVAEPGGFQFSELDNIIDRVVLPMRERISAAGREPLVNLNMVDFGGGAWEHRDDPQEYAEFASVMIHHIRDTYGFTPDGLELVLEADLAGWNAQQVGDAVVATADRLRSEGFSDLHFSAPSNTAMNSAVAFFKEWVETGHPILGEDAGGRRYLDEFTYHRYDTLAGGGPNAYVGEVIWGQFGYDTAQLEKIGANYPELHSDLGLANNSFWAQYAFGPGDSTDRGGTYFVVDEHDQIVYGWRTEFLAHYMQYIEPGAIRIGATTDDQSQSPVAFVNADGSWVVVVRLDAPGPLSLEGLPAGVYGVLFSTFGDTLNDMGTVVVGDDGVLMTSAPAFGLLSIFTVPAPGGLGLLGVSAVVKFLRRPRRV